QRCALFGGVDRPVTVLDLATGQEQFSRHESTGFATADGRHIVSVMGNTLKVWDAATGRTLHTLKGHTAAVLGVAVSADGQRIASASSDKTVRVWDAATGRPLHVLSGHTAEVNCLALSADGQRLVSGSAVDTKLKVWDTATGKELLT